METTKEYYKKTILDIAKLIEESRNNKNHVIINFTNNFVYIGLGFFEPETLEFLRMDFETARKTCNDLNHKQNPNFKNNFELKFIVITVDEYLNEHFKRLS